MKQGLFLMVAGLAGIAVTASAVNAGSLTLGTSGWTAFWADNLDSQLTLNVDAVGSDAVYIEKSMVFTNNDPIRILFQQNPGETAVSNIVINDEILTNRTNDAWDGFTMTVSSLTGDAHFDAAKTALGQSGGFSVSPFTTAGFNDTNTVLTVGGGVIPNQPIGANVWYPGTQGDLWILSSISTAPLRAVTLVEQPSVAAIPLPAALWSGLAGLAGLGLLGAVRKRKFA